MDEKLSKTYCNPQGYWKSIATIKKLAVAANVPENDAKNGWTSKSFSKFIFLRQNIYLALNSMCPRQMQFTKHTFFFFHTTLWGMVRVEKHTNTLWPSSTWPAFSKKLRHCPWKTRLKSGAILRKFTNAGLWNGHSFCKWTTGTCSWALSLKK